MQPDNIPPNSGRVAFRYGLIIGIILAVVEAVIVIINTFVSFANLAATTNASSTPNLGSSLLSLGLSGVGLLLGLTAYFVAGILAARQTGRVSTGVFAGMWTGTFYGVIISVVSLVLFFTVMLEPTLGRLSSSVARIEQLRTITIAASLIGGIIGGIIGIAIAVGIGAGMGALGGLIGQKSWRKTHPQPAFPPPYPGQMYAPNMPMQQYPAQGPGYRPPQPWPYAPPQPWMGGAYPANPEQARPQPARPPVESVERAERAEGTQLDTSTRPPQSESQGWAGTVPQPRSIQPSEESELENPYSN